MTTNHTPGIWTADEYGEITSTNDIGDDIEICQILGNIKDKEEKANTLLILAAPALRAALEQMLHRYGSNFISYSEDHPVAIARAAIEKTTGVAA